MSPIYTAGLILFIMLGVIGCGQLGDGPGVTRREENPSPVPTTPKPSPTVDLSGKLDLLLKSPAVVAPGETVPLELRLKNVSNQPVKLELWGLEENHGFPAAYDFLVTKPDGTKVWQWLDGKVWPAMSYYETLDPNQQLIFAAEWRQVDTENEAVPAAMYHVTGFFRGGQHTPILETQSQQIVISPTPP